MKKHRGIFQPRYRDKKTGEWKNSATLWIRLSEHGREITESADTTSVTEAIAYRNKRLGELATGKSVGPEKLTLDGLLEGVTNDYKLNDLRSARVLVYRSKHLRGYFGGTCKVREITSDRIRAYATQRKAQGASNATINREFSLLRRGFKLASEAGRVTFIPVLKKLTEADPRGGFFEPGEHLAVVAALAEPYDRIWEVEHDTGWRAMEVLTRRKSHVDLENGWLRLDPGEAKNREGRQFPLTPQLREVIVAQLEWSRAVETKLGTILPDLWHDEKGWPIKYDRYYRAWRKVVPAGRIAHDLRRTAAKELDEAGISQKTAMDMMGHKTPEIFRRYAIGDSRTLQEAGAALAARQAPAPPHRSLPR